MIIVKIILALAITLVFTVAFNMAIFVVRLVYSEWRMSKRVLRVDVPPEHVRNVRRMLAQREKEKNK